MEDPVLQQTNVTLGRLDASAEWLKQTDVILYPLPTINSPRMTCLLLVRIPEQEKGKALASSRMDLEGFRRGSYKPIFLPALSAQQTLDEQYIAILLDFKCAVVDEDFSRNAKLLLSSHKSDNQ
jgi:hypothetical protein